MRGFCDSCAKPRNVFVDPAGSSLEHAGVISLPQCGPKATCADCGVPSAEHTADAALARQCSIAAAMCICKVHKRAKRPQSRRIVAGLGAASCDNYLSESIPLRSSGAQLAWSAGCVTKLFTRMWHSGRVTWLLVLEDYFISGLQHSFVFIAALARTPR
jgi:hypothetical protein